MDFREGGTERSRYRMNETHAVSPAQFSPNDGTYQDIVPGRRIVLATSMTLATGGSRCSLITVELLESTAQLR